MGDQALSTLLNMGFGYEESTAALENCKKDVSDAVAYLTDPSRSAVPYGPQMENKQVQPMEIETFYVEEEDFPQAGDFIIKIILIGGWRDTGHPLILYTFLVLWTTCIVYLIMII